jgi:TatD DNase family protein
MFVDSHAHLEGNKYDSDRTEVFARAAQAGVNSVLCIGNSDTPDGFDCAIKLAEQFPNVYATVGIHPHEAKLGNDDLYANLSGLAKHPKIIGWGEIGLDYHYDHSPRDVQRAVFVRQMQLAREAKNGAGLPIIIHCRPTDNTENAWQETFALIREHRSGQSERRGIIHCFTGEPKHMQGAVELGFMVSFSGAITFPKAENIRAAARECPLDRILIETDSPYLAPIPYRGKRNEPAYVIETAKKIAEVRGASLEEIGEATTRNFKRFFNLP